MNIAFFTDNFYPELSGVTDVIAFTAKELGKLGHHIHIFAPKHPPKNYKIGNVPYKEIDLGPNVIIRRLPSLPIPMPTMQGRLLIPNPFRVFEKEKFDIIHTHSFWGPGIEAKWLAKKQNIPLVGTNHTIIESFSPIDNHFVKSALKNYVINYFNKCDLATAPSNFLLQKMIAGGLTTASTSISNPIEDSFFTQSRTKAELKKQLGLKTFTTIYIGRISKEKNVRTLVKTFIEFAKDKPDTNLVIIGQGTERKELEKLATDSQVSGQISFLGPYSGQDRKILIDYLQASDIFTIPSTSENQSMCVLQAMACGLPTVAANAEGLPELVGNERGLLFAPDDIADLNEKLDGLYTDADLREKFSKNARLFAETLRANNVAKEWEKLYNSVITKYKNSRQS